MTHAQRFQAADRVAEIVPVYIKWQKDAYSQHGRQWKCLMLCDIYGLMGDSMCVIHDLQTVKGFQEYDEDVETWMACDAEDCIFQMLSDNEIVISMQENSDPVDDEADEDEDINNENSKGHQMLTPLLR
ncbi:uncharacterized protein TNCV_4432931 [Trichonephila clavipes]|nr:uncharacterized protein TNCV_4432931 [Trichonephila clavipes]